jgi:hypothetical protein
MRRKTKKDDKAQDEPFHSRPDAHDTQDTVVNNGGRSAPRSPGTGRPHKREVPKALSVPMPTRIVPRGLYTGHNSSPAATALSNTIAETTKLSPEQLNIVVAGNNLSISPRRSSLAFERTSSTTNDPSNTHPTSTTCQRSKRPLSVVVESNLEYEFSPCRRAGLLPVPALKFPANKVHRYQGPGINEDKDPFAFEQSPVPAFEKAERKRLARALRKRPLRRTPIPETWQEIAEGQRLERLVYKPLKGRTPIPEEWKLQPSNDCVNDKESVKSFVTAVSEQCEDGELGSKRADSASWVATSADRESSTWGAAVPQAPHPRPVYDHTALRAHTAGPMIRQRLASSPILLSRNAFTIPCAWPSSARTRRVAWV